MFDLPETIPQKNKKKGRAIALAAGIHVLLVATIIVSKVSSFWKPQSLPKERSTK